MYWRVVGCASVSSAGIGDTAATAVAARNSRLSTSTSSKIGKKGIAQTKMPKKLLDHLSDIESAVCAAGSLAVARRAERRELPGDSGHPAEAELTEDEKRELLGRGD